MLECLKLRRDRDKLGNFGVNSIEAINNLYCFSENINQSNESQNLAIGFPQNLSAIFGIHVKGYTGYVRRVKYVLCYTYAKLIHTHLYIDLYIALSRHDHQH